MRQYIALFKLKFINNLQYRSAALAGIGTQLFFGLVYISIYVAFYSSNDSSAPMNLTQIVNYLWLQQSFFALIYVFQQSKDILNMIRNGDIAYELCRPQNVYVTWFIKLYASRLSGVLLRFLPVLIIAFILPAPYGLMLPDNMWIIPLFIISILIASILATSLCTILHILTFYTLEADGIVGMFATVAEIFSGSTVPIPFFPKFLQIIAYILPFRYIADLPLRIYCGSISISSAIPNILLQIVWTIIMIVIGYQLTKNALKKVVVQGG